MANQAVQVSGIRVEIANRIILDNLDLTIMEGETMGVIGTSGGGKSTLIKAMAGLLPAQSGSIKINGREIVGASDSVLASVRSDVGFVFQYSALFDSLTVFDNIALAPMRRLGYSREKALELAKEKLAQVRLGDVLNYFPSQLSGGMAKRVGLARALAMNPKLLFYDEPTSGLDPPTARSIDQLILQMRDELHVTSVVVSHDLPALVRFADRIALLDKGKVILVETPAKFVESDNPLVQGFVSAGRFEF